MKSGYIYKDFIRFYSDLLIERAGLPNVGIKKRIAQLEEIKVKEREYMQSAERVVDSFLEVLKIRIMKKEDCEQILSQVGASCDPKYVPCKVIQMKEKKNDTKK